MTTILDGKRLADLALDALKARIERLPNPPRLIVLVEREEADTRSFVRLKAKAASAIGIEVVVKEYDPEISATRFSRLLHEIAKNSRYDGIVVQLPLPRQLHANRASFLGIIPASKDVDCLSEYWQGRLMSGRTHLDHARGSVILTPPVVAAVKALAQHYGIAFGGAHAVLIGWGDLVGKPLVPFLLREGATVTICTSKTKDLKRFTRLADIIVAGAGKPRLVTGDMIQQGAIVFDAGSSLQDGVFVGDVDRASVEGIAGALAPSRGGIGPLVVVSLFANCIAAAEART